MAQYDYSRAAESARRLIDRFGTDASLRRTLAGTGDKPWSPSSQGDTSQDWACRAAVVDYSQRERGEGRIPATDRRALIAATGIEVEPTVGDRLVVAGRTYGIVNCSIVAPGGTSVLYDMQVTS